MVRFFPASLVAAVVVALSASAADAGEKAPLWSKSCPQGGDKASCFVEQFAVAQPRNVPVLRARFDFGGKPITLPFERCTSDGCDVVVALDEEALKKFERGKTLTVRYAVSAKKAPSIPIRLKGLAEALRTLLR